MDAPVLGTYRALRAVCLSIEGICDSQIITRRGLDLSADGYLVLKYDGVSEGESPRTGTQGPPVGLISECSICVSTRFEVFSECLCGEPSVVLEVSEVSRLDVRGSECPLNTEGLIGRSEGHRCVQWVNGKLRSISVPESAKLGCGPVCEWLSIAVGTDCHVNDTQSSEVCAIVGVSEDILDLDTVIVDRDYVIINPDWIVISRVFAHRGCNVDRSIRDSTSINKVVRRVRHYDSQFLKGGDYPVEYYCIMEAQSVRHIAKPNSSLQQGIVCTTSQKETNKMANYPISIVFN